jgi:DNA polymerase III gamma/tau subunit
MRDMMVLQSAGADSKVLVLTEEEKQRLQQVADKFDIAALIYNITALEKLRWTLRNSETSRALLEASLLRLALSEHFIGLDQLSAKLSGGQTPVAPSKKKWLNSPSVAPDVKKSQTAPLNPPFSVDGNIDSIRAAWSAVTAQCGQMDSSAGAFLSQASPIFFENSTLSLQFPNHGQGQLAKSMCERKSKVIESALSKLFAVEVKIRLVLGDSEKPATKDKTPEQPPQTAPQINRQQRQEALNDPVVQMVLKGLDATPLEIQKIDIPMDVDEEQTDIPVEE